MSDVHERKLTRFSRRCKQMRSLLRDEASAPTLSRIEHELHKVRRNAVVLLFLLLLVGLLQSGCARTQPLTIRLAGDEWFLDSLTKTGLISEFEHKSGIRRRGSAQEDRAIMSDLDRGPSRGDTLDVIVVGTACWASWFERNRYSRSIRFSPIPPWHDPAFIPTASNCFPTGGANSVHTMAKHTDIPSPASRLFCAIAKIC